MRQVRISTWPTQVGSCATFTEVPGSNTEIQLSVIVTELPTLGYVWKGEIQTSTLPEEFAPNQKVTLIRSAIRGDTFSFTIQ